MGIVIAGKRTGCHLPSNGVCRIDLDGAAGDTRRAWATAKKERRKLADGAARRAIVE